MLTIVASRITISWAIAMKASARQRLGLSCDFWDISLA
jgi:hypothetical protein